MNAEAWATVGTIVATIVLVVAPAILYAWSVLDDWIGDPKSYARVLAEIDRRRDGRDAEVSGRGAG